MITQVANVTIYVLDLDRAISFYTDKLSFQLFADIRIAGGMRWAALHASGAPSFQLLMIPVEKSAFLNGRQVRQLRGLIEQHIFSYGVFRCRNLLATCDELKSRGVSFLMEPGQGFLGQYEAAFLDDSGNWFRLTQDEGAV